MKAAADYTDDEKHRLVEAYNACQTGTEKRLLASELGMPVERLYNLCSRWSSLVPS